MLSAKSNRNAENNSENRERYRYEALPIGSQDASHKKSIEMNINRTDSQSTFTMKSVSAKEVEHIRLELDADGNFVSGTRNVVHPSGKHKFEGSMRRERQTVFVKRRSGEGWRIKTYNLPKNKLLAVDGSLLLLLRSFPFEQNKEEKLFMVDFSQNSVTVTVRQAGLDNIRVKAGEFECYRMEVIVHVLVFRPKITYWISKMKPHFLVKHRGKIGPFSRTYVTQLVSIE